jgi:STE24 endopeptidase
MAAVRGLLSAAPRWQERTELAVPTMLLMSLTFTALAPLILRFVWRAVPLPPGQIRDELLILGKKLRFRFTDILVWPAGGVSNAVVSGLVPQLRYVMLSDALLDKLSPPEIGAVFGHEVGHVKHHHISYYFAFLIGSVGLLSLIALFCQQQAQALFSDAMNRNLDFVFSYVPLELFLLFPYFGLVFGYLSRQCERQADLFGVRAASQAIVDWKTSMTAAFPFLTTSAGHLATTDGCRLGNGHAPAKGWFVAVLADPSTLVEDPPPPAVSSLPKGNYPAVLPEGAGVYAQMLDKLAYLNGISKRAWSWRHGSIASRIEFVETVREDPSLADRFDRRLRRFRWGLLVGLVLGIFVFGWLTGALTLESFPKLL